MSTNVIYNRTPLADQPLVDEKPSSDIEAPIPTVSEKPGTPTVSSDDGHPHPPPPYAVDTKVVTTDDARAAIDAADFTPNAQPGVLQAEAITSAWTKPALYTAYILIWIIYFIDTMQQSTTGALTPYVTSAFGLHSTIAATGIVANVVGGIVKLPLAKILDIWGRPQGFLLMVFLLTMGLVMMAGCKNVETYAAAQVFYWVGYNGLTYTLGIFIADTSQLKNRAFMFAYASSPYLATTWIGGPLATAFLNGPVFRWGFGAFAIITPAVTLPLFFVFYVNYNKAYKMGLIKKPENNRTMWETVKHHTIEFDVMGVFLLCAGLSLFLLPFSLYSYQKDKWESGMIIAMLVLGILCLIAFVAWEKWGAKTTFIPYDLLMDRTVFSSCVLTFCLFVEYWLWAAYFFSFNQVVMGLSITEATYVGNTYSMGSCGFALIVGLLIRKTGKFKWLAVWFGVPVTILGVGLMIHFRSEGQSIGYVVMCQVFIAVAGGTLVICEQTAAMASTSHQFVAVVLAIQGCFSSIGGAVGLAIAGAIWTKVFPEKLREFLPADAPWETIYGDITAQMGYPMGSIERIAINKAYGEAQKILCISAVSVLAVAWASVFFWRDINVKNFKQVKGVVL